MRWIVAVLVGGLILAGCSGDDDQAETVPPRAATAPTSGAATSSAPGDLASKLLTVDDLPTGWAVQPADDEEEADECGAAVAQEPTATATISFLGGSFGPALVEVLSVYDDAEHQFDAMTSVFDDCQGSDGTTYLPLSFPKLGDETFASRITGGEGGSGDVVLIREGSTILVLAHAGLVPPSTEDTEQFARKALAKL